MNNSKNKYAILAGLTVIIAGSIYLNRPAVKAISTSVASTQKTEVKTAVKTIPAHIEAVVIPTSELSEFKGIALDEKKSLVTLTSLIDEALTNPSSLNLMVQKLDELHLKPLVMKESNPQTGSLDIVRTNEALPGTRYLHAQYFSSEDGSNFLQHVSFEFKGNKESFDMLKKVVQKQFKITEPPTTENKKFIAWNVDGRSVWIKKLDIEDLTKKSPFNAYDAKNDVGTIRFGSEAEIH